MELGLAMMMVFGVRGVVLVYLGTLLALSLSYFLGRWVSLGRVAKLFGWLKLERARQVVEALAGVSREERLAMMLSVAPGRWVAFMLRHRYLSLMILLNLPGNALLGGGGGIGFMAGSSGLLAYPGYIMAVALAILPFPLMFLWQASG